MDSKFKRMPSGELDDDSIMTFGTHKGKKLKDIPASYLKYMYDMDYFYGSMKNYVKDNYNIISKEVKHDWK